MDDRSLVLVVGPGRSGTSSMAGAIASSGFHVPGAIRGNKTNPTGFFEPRWVVDLHKRLLADVGLRTLDPDPDGLALVEELNRDQALRAEVRAWLTARFEEHPKLVLKDPRMMWFTGLWTEVARDLGVEPGYVIMVRHPSEVSASRSTYYASRDVGAVGGWINVALLTEQVTAGARRRFVHYPDLLTNWRKQLAGVATSLDITFDPPIEQQPHPVDDLIDPALRREHGGWEDVAVPPVLSELADRVFETLRAASHLDAESATERLAELRGEYLDFYACAQALTLSHSRRDAEELRRKVKRRLRAKWKERQAAAGSGAAV